MNEFGIIGAGLSAYGAFLALKRHNLLGNVKFYASGAPIIPVKNIVKPFPSFDVPEKTEFNNRLLYKSINGTHCKIRHTNTLGGLSDFWSCSLFPFTENNKYFQELEGNYGTIHGLLRVSGKNGPLDDIYQSFPYVLNSLSSSLFEPFDSLNYVKDDNVKLNVGDNRVVLNKACIKCDQCYLGCTNGSLFRPSAELIGMVVNAHISYIRKIDNGYELFDTEGIVIDRVKKLFIAAGVHGTLELLYKSNMLPAKKIEVYDSNAIMFPIIYYGKPYQGPLQCFSFANKIIRTSSQSPKLNTHISIVPFGELFLNEFFGSIVGNLVKKFFMKRIFLGCFFSSADEANTYLYNGAYSSLKTHVNDAKNSLKKIANTINKSGLKLWIPPLSISTDSSSHYSTNLLDGNLGLFKRSMIDDSLFIIDGNLFPGSPEPAPNSFSIITGAYTVVDSAIKESRHFA